MHEVMNLSPWGHIRSSGEYKLFHFTRNPDSHYSAAGNNHFNADYDPQYQQEGTEHLLKNESHGFCAHTETKTLPQKKKQNTDLPVSKHTLKHSIIKITMCKLLKNIYLKQISHTWFCFQKPLCKSQGFI